MSLLALRIGMKNNFGLDKGEVAKGNYGQVSIGLFKDREIAMKFIPFGRKSENQNELEIIFKEVFMTKLASALSVGPKFSDVFGYDLLIFYDGAQFCMEKCETELKNEYIKE